MAVYEVTGPNGEVFEVTAPDNLSEDEVKAQVEQQLGQQPQGRQFGQLESFGRGALQGGTLGFSDEIGAGIGAGFNALTGQGEGFSEDFSRLQGEISGANQGAREQNPGTFLAGELASVVVPGGPAARVAGLGGKALGKLLPEAGRFAQGAAQGGTVGATFGAGATEGGLAERAQGAGIGLGLGLGLGAVTPGAVDLVAGAGRGIARTLGLGNQTARGQQKFAEALMRDHTPDVRFDQGAVQALERKLANIRQTKPQATLADVGGENTKNLLRAAANVASTGANKLNKFLDKRQFSQNERLERDLGKALGNPSEFATSVDDIIRQRGQAANEEFALALAVETPLTPQLRSVLERPVVKLVQRRAQQRLANEGQPIGLESRTREIHLIKMELDDMIGAAKRAQATGNKPQAGINARTLQIVKKDLLGAVNNPSYKDALKNFAGASALKDAAEEGFDKALKLSTEQLGKTFRDLSSSERELFKLGAVRAIAGKMRTLDRMRDRTKNLFSNPDIEQRLRVLIPDQRTRRELQRSIQIERNFAETRRAIQGGSTTAKQLAQGQQAGEGVGFIEQTRIGKDIFTGNLSGIALALAKGASNRFSGLTSKTANAIMEAGMDTGSATSRALNRALAKAEKSPVRHKKIADALTRSSTLSGTQGLVGGIGPRFDEFGNLKRGQGF